MDSCRTFVVITLFPEPVLGMLNSSILKKAQDKGLVRFIVLNLRDFGNGRYRSTDDYPYGGGGGMILRPEPVFRALQFARKILDVPLEDTQKGAPPSLRIVYPTPQGQVFHQKDAWAWSLDPRPILFLAGHYEGIDERILLGNPIEEWSAGDYVLTGGELPSLSMIDAVVRLLPGVLSDPQAPQKETFSGEMFDYPQYTRPPVFEGMEVPEVLLSGNHARIVQFRREKAREKTLRVRPELLE
ncbi:tRNA (guanosine(37)-N1)-methyltransferase TrmD [Leptospirillum ferriphilum]|jgi:tRNA (guanine37-N1)-methyltransferase|uniref:tRNA (guanine-N(1)-)-methyltransferase n=4 Tax=Leptospirillum ferriphilum TaxID=178606 RepID=A0A059XTI4_9BACT|nr:tRNA (guanosine(37)-N1)-methyltransferase TrmD [Leptospirillum ferriphilum]AFS53329.1 tRNA-(guanine-N1)-methyltransferase [Leptospirillum ferriphilum ML-04]AIA30365.1 tRNA (guanine-N1)-methyltransferase [Leptospirillum ferriphilum YSK]OOH75091.1 tRNA (guanosine(37)-N1)-methyltransferase TrmD [Leptospirillum ferriphilum]OOH78478.1 tRNA (guanosine(37)-N1)-methyltransferase TrmD [Leptospirillum ferriphilum]